MYGILHRAVPAYLRGGPWNYSQRPAHTGRRHRSGRPVHFPYGTVLYIEGIGIRIVQDKGAAIQGKHLDVAVDTHENAEKWNGCGNHRVWVLKEE